jgi:protein SCO1/2
MDHSAASFVYDTEGRLRLYARYGAGVPAMVSDVKALLKS